jgi:hypothetical protein
MHAGGDAWCGRAAEACGDDMFAQTRTRPTATWCSGVRHLAAAEYLRTEIRPPPVTLQTCTQEEVYNRLVFEVKDGESSDELP